MTTRRALIVSALGAVVARGASAQDPPPRIIHVVSNGWHSGIVAARADLPRGALPEAAEFSDLAWLEIGWGDRDYYPASSPTILMAIAAGIGANKAVIHVAGRARVPEISPPIDVVPLTLTSPGFAAMIAGIDATFDRGAAARAERVAPGLAPRAAFFAAHGRFNLANTCNTWVAARLAEGGVAISTEGIVTASDLMTRLRALPDAASRP